MALDPLSINTAPLLPNAASPDTSCIVPVSTPSAELIDTFPLGPEELPLPDLIVI
jgi:hypothetical protein